MQTNISHTLLPLAAMLALGVAANAHAQTIGFNIRTGDVWMDTRVVEINQYGNEYRDPFVNEMVSYYDVPRPYVDELMVQRHWAPGDVYMACSLAHSLGRPCSYVVEEYERDHGQGWGVTARRLGIKPGSREFFMLKNGVSHTYGRWGHPIAVNSSRHVKWHENGKSESEHSGKAMHGKFKPAKNGHGSSVKHGDGDSGKHGHGEGKQSKGHGGEKGHGHGHGK